MPDVRDMDLLRDYQRQGSEEAFAELVRRHVNLVYSAALRHAGIAAHAEEITQAVFVILARKAAGLRPDTILDAWLYETTWLTALSFLRGERRRQWREQEAYMQSTFQESTGDPVWHQLSPLLDEAMARLGKKDREAVVLRFFKEKSLREVAAALQVTEAAAQSRVHRALEKLHRYFARRGVSSTTAIIAGAISANSVQAAPVALAKAVTAVALAKGTTASTSTVTLIKGALKIMAWTKAKTTAVTVAAVILAAGTTTIVIKSHTARSNANLPPATWAKLNRQILTGGLNQAHEIPNAIYTYPDGDETTHRYLESLVKMFAKNTGPGRTIKSDRELTEQDIQTRTIYIYGSPQNHSLFRRVRDQLPILFEDDGIVVGNKKCKGRDVGAIFVCPNPVNPKNSLVIYGTVSPDALNNMNGIFHGPTDYIVFNNQTRHFWGVNVADQFLLMGSFDKSDPINWRVDETLQVLPPDALQRATAGVIVAR
ncbi:MAG: sigma-70 family RNA polymerase sigma factor [Verrucomicrobiota bacterium]|jgi:RNA polymerase sigma factor (sigma-70 family)